MPFDPAARHRYNLVLNLNGACRADAVFWRPVQIRNRGSKYMPLTSTMEQNGFAVFLVHDPAFWSQFGTGATANTTFSVVLNPIQSARTCGFFALTRSCSGLFRVQFLGPSVLRRFSEIISSSLLFLPLPFHRLPGGPSDRTDLRDAPCCLPVPL